MNDPEEVQPIGIVLNEAGDSVAIGLQGGKVHLEVANEGREPVEVWLASADARAVADLLERATGA